MLPVSFIISNDIGRYTQQQLHCTICYCVPEYACLCGFALSRGLSSYKKKKAECCTCLLISDGSQVQLVDDDDDMDEMRRFLSNLNG